MKRPVFNKRRVFLFVLLFPTILAVAIMTAISIRGGSSKGAAKKWLKQNRPDSVLLDTSAFTSTVDGVTEKSLVCTCMDTNTGVIWSQEFVRRSGSWTAEDGSADPYGYARMTDGYQSVIRLGARMTTEGIPCTPIFLPGKSFTQSCLVVAPDVSGDKLAELWAQVSACAAADPTVFVRMIAAPKEICDAVLSADRIGFQKKYYDRSETGSVNELAQMIHKRKQTLMTCELNRSGGTDAAATTAEAIARIQQAVQTDANTVWELTAEGVAAYTFS